jgi:hypothetical protein
MKARTIIKACCKHASSNNTCEHTYESTMEQAFNLPSDFAEGPLKDNFSLWYPTFKRSSHYELTAAAASVTLFLLCFSALMTLPIHKNVCPCYRVTSVTGFFLRKVELLLALVAMSIGKCGSPSLFHSSLPPAAAARAQQALLSVASAAVAAATCNVYSCRPRAEQGCQMKMWCIRITVPCAMIYTAQLLAHTILSRDLSPCACPNCQVFTHPDVHTCTNCAQRCFTSVIIWESVCPTW